MRTLLGFVLAASVGLVACSGDGGTGGSGGSGGGGNGGDFHLNDVTLAYTEVPDGIKKASLFFYIGWANCPSNLDCNEDLTIEIAGPAAAVNIGPPSSWMSLPQDKLDAVEQILASNPAEVYLNWELSRDNFQMGGTWGPSSAPQSLTLQPPRRPTLSPLPVLCWSVGRRLTESPRTAVKRSLRTIAQSLPLSGTTI
ncbi:MAG: hypothetical protein IPK82_34150 [Polyangiaceae bacterium]|nr:hypothetical protein [Polyangiaceae bacterium]